MNKYNVGNNDGRTYNGIIFDSRLEMQYYRDVLLPTLAMGSISEIKRQVPFILQPAFKHAGKAIRAINYIADFVITYSDGTTKVIEIKGKPTQDALLKRKMFYFKYPELNLVWLSWTKKTGWIDFDKLKEIRRKNK